MSTLYEGATSVRLSMFARQDSCDADQMIRDKGDAFMYEDPYRWIRAVGDGASISMNNLRRCARGGLGPADGILMLTVSRRTPSAL